MAKCVEPLTRFFGSNFTLPPFPLPTMQCCDLWNFADVSYSNMSHIQHGNVKNMKHAEIMVQRQSIWLPAAQLTISGYDIVIANFMLNWMYHNISQHIVLHYVFMSQTLSEFYVKLNVPWTFLSTLYSIMFLCLKHSTLHGGGGTPL